jgi:hypothetical protein
MLGNFSLADISENAQEIFILTANLACPERKGGYFCILEENFSTPLIIARVGVIEAEGEASKYFGFVQEKARRLWVAHSHRSSWQSRNVEENKFGGAVRVGGLIISFSGLTESADEIISLGLAYVLGVADKSDIFAISKISANPHMEKLWNIIGQ